MECPKAALRSDLPAGAKVVLTALWSYAGREKRFVWPSRDTLAAACGMKPRTLRRWLTVLLERQWITEHTVNGRKGWDLCDPPGTPVVSAPPVEDATHDRPVKIGQAPVKIGQAPVKTGQAPVKTGHAPVKTGQAIGQNRPPLPYRNQPRTNQEPTTEQAAPSVDASAWRVEFWARWAPLYAGATPRSGWQHPDPTQGPHRLQGLQVALDAHGPQVVTDALLHAGAEMARWRDTGGRSGVDPRRLSALFVAGKEGAWAAVLDAWQRDTHQRRTSGRISATPQEIDGRTLTDEEARAWMVAGGGREGLWAVQDQRRAEEADDAAGTINALLSGIGGAA